MWIVKEAREEHRSAIEWLNNNTNNKVGFFLIEIHAYKIGDSDPAPMFQIVEQPNDFIKNNKWNPNSYENMIREWYDATFRDVVNPDWTSYYVWEWEVLYPKKTSWKDSRNYLEDIVEIVEGAESEWINPQKLINKYWNLINQLKQLWLSDEELAAANDAIYQGWLFWWEPVKTAKVENWVLKKAKKSSKKSDNE